MAILDYRTILALSLGLGQLSSIIPQFHNYYIIVVVVPIIIVGVGRCFSTVGTSWGQGVGSVMVAITFVVLLVAI